MALKPVLIIAPFFAPQSHAAMFRVHKLVKYLPRYGYRPIVVTTDTNYLFNEDSELLKELADEVVIKRVRYIEPTLRGLRMLFGGSDRTFKTLKNNGFYNATEKKAQGLLEQKQKGSLKSSVMSFVKNSPDVLWTWAGPATRASQKLIQEYDIKVFYTTANPDSVLKIGLNLKQTNQVKWLADFRDPLHMGTRYRHTNRFSGYLATKWVREAMEMSDHVSGLSSAYGSIFSDLYDLPEKKFSFIPTGVDDEYLKDKRELVSTSPKVLLFQGEFQKEYSQYPFNVLESVLSNPDHHDVILQIIGRKEVNQPLFEEKFKGSSLLKKCEYIDHIPQRELYHKISKAHCCLLLSGPVQQWWNNYAKMVDYIGLNKLILASVPEVSEARRELEKAELGYFLTGDFEIDCAIVEELLSANSDTGGCEYRNRYTATVQAESFAKLFGELYNDE